MTTTWFEELFGFAEQSYDETRRNLEVVGTTLRSRVNGRSFAVGDLSTPSVKELRHEAAGLVTGLRGRLTVSNVHGDVRAMHADPENRHALFQVASQFNLLEMTGPDLTPEHGITRYAHDHTQGPACALSASAATAYRNYFAPVDGQIGQTRHHQIDCLSDVGARLGNAGHSLWEMRNGYALCTQAGLSAIDQIHSRDPGDLDEVRDLLRIGIHSGVQVTDVPDEHLVSQAFCSALPVSYSDLRAEHWERFAVLVLEGAYEATLWAAVINAHRTGANVVLLTLLGGGAFGNEPAWIHGAMRRALRKVVGIGLDVRVVSFHEPDLELRRLVAAFA
jgi:hypothetical protein